MKNLIKSSNKLLNNVVVRLIVLYQKTISPDHGIFQENLKTFHCKFYPSCSGYALDSIRQYGLRRGAVLSLLRILNCNPFSRGGYDPVK
ncbi:MAG: membrane protein insertion efficiency factor YidD [bacterium]|nr:membrane protein insertion efficiency factor YidD [bacterium]